jgi:hypothetical protein
MAVIQHELLTPQVTPKGDKRQSGESYEPYQ